MTLHCNFIDYRFISSQSPCPMPLFSLPLSRRFSPASGGRTRAFSLVELLAVIAIIVILAAIGATILRGNTVGVSSAASQVSNAIASARQLAISKNCRTRFIIITDAVMNPEDWRLKRYTVLRIPENVADTTSTSPFVQATELGDLGNGVFFRDNVHVDVGVNAPNSMFKSTYRDQTQINGVKVEYAYIEFLPNGTTSRSSTENIFEIEKAPSFDKSIPNNTNYVRIGVAQYTGRVKYQRPSL